ncbi:hypothetical protein BC943DRAFT_331212 [Umbelopsis sp. AD052]|nr:hypothetical protein BC943DRAFT_331212 [Umbelopsis sp. AD052]
MATDGHLKSTTGESICYIERKPTADQKAWLQNQDTLHEKDVISMAIRDKSDQHDNKTLLVMLQEESSQQLNEDSSKKTTLEHVNKSLIKLDSGYHEYDEDHHDTKASSESSGPIDRSMRTPSPPPRRKIIPPATLEKRTISTVEDLFKELEEEEEYIKEDAVYADEDDGRELIFVHREFKIRTGTLITDHRWALDDSSSSGEEETLCQTRSQPRNLFPSEEYQRTLDDNDKKDEIDDFFMSM